MCHINPPRPNLSVPVPQSAEPPLDFQRDSSASSIRRRPTFRLFVTFQLDTRLRKTQCGKTFSFATRHTTLHFSRNICTSVTRASRNKKKTNLKNREKESSGRVKKVQDCKKKKEKGKKRRKKMIVVKKRANMHGNYTSE